MTGQEAARILVASNRGPVTYRIGREGGLVDGRTGGGLVPALAGIGEAEWVCAAMGDGDRRVAAAEPGGRLRLPSGPAVRMLTLEQATFERAYNVVANSVLWFLHHLLDSALPPYDATFMRAWADYQSYNAAFADAIAEDAAPRARVVVHDYHLALVPGLLRLTRPDLAVAHVSHTPFAPPEWLGTLPDAVTAALLRGMLQADHLAFHTARWAGCFAACCTRLLGASQDATGVIFDGHRTTLGVHPLGVDGEALRARVSTPEVADRAARLRAAHPGQALVVRVDRTEPSKNVVRGLLAYRELLRTRPQWRGRVVHVAFAYPSRYGLPEYRAHTDVVAELARDIEDEFGGDGWRPVVLEVADDLPRSLAALSVADVVLVNPVRDGMNLVAKEAPVVSADGLALVLSREAGAADELAGEALVVNPYDVSETAAALDAGLRMPPAERRSRTARLAALSTALPPRAWFQSILASLESSVTAR